MHTLTLGEVSISRIVEIGRSAFPTAQMLPESDAGRVASMMSSRLRAETSWPSSQTKCAPRPSRAAV